MFHCEANPCGHHLTGPRCDISFKESLGLIFYITETVYICLWINVLIKLYNRLGGFLINNSQRSINGDVCNDSIHRFVIWFFSCASTTTTPEQQKSVKTSSFHAFMGLYMALLAFVRVLFFLFHSDYGVLFGGNTGENTWSLLWDTFLFELPLIFSIVCMLEMLGMFVGLAVYTMRQNTALPWIRRLIVLISIVCIVTSLGWIFELGGADDFWIVLYSSWLTVWILVIMVSFIVLACRLTRLEKEEPRGSGSGSVHKFERITYLSYRCGLLSGSLVLVTVVSVMFNVYDCPESWFISTSINRAQELILVYTGFFYGFFSTPLKHPGKRSTTVSGRVTQVVGGIRSKIASRLSAPDDQGGGEVVRLSSPQNQRLSLVAMSELEEQREHELSGVQLDVEVETEMLTEPDTEQRRSVNRIQKVIDLDHDYHGRESKD